MVQEETTPQEKAVAHTALPWRLSANTSSQIHILARRADIYGEDSAHVRLHGAPDTPEALASLRGDSAIRKANAAFIVRACNSHYQLLSALKAALPHLHWANTHADRCDEAIRLAEQAISAAEEGL